MKTSIFSGALTLLLLWEAPARTLTNAVPPAPPLNSLVTGAVVLVLTPNSGGAAQNISAFAGASPFVQPSIDAVRNWKFVAARGLQKQAPVSVTILYRARQMFGSGGIQFPDWPASQDRPPLPRAISDPAYPSNSVGEGVVILELTISPQEGITRVDVVHDVPS